MPKLTEAMELMTDEAARLCTSIYLRSKEGSYDDHHRLAATQKMTMAYLYADRISSQRQDVTQFWDIDLSKGFVLPQTPTEAAESIRWAEGVTAYLKARSNLLLLRELARSVGVDA